MITTRTRPHHGEAAPGFFVKLKSVDGRQLHLWAVLGNHALHVSQSLAALGRHGVANGRRHMTGRVVDEEVEWEDAVTGLGFSCGLGFVG